MLSVFCDLATQHPSRPFLYEDKDILLTYEAAQLLALKLIAPRLRALAPARETTQIVAVLLMHNTSLLPLLLISLWSIGARVVPLSPTADPHLWAGMIRLVDPSIILVSPALDEALKKALDAGGSATKAYNTTDISTLLAPHIVQASTNRLTRCIPSLLSWIAQEIGFSSTSAAMAAEFESSSYMNADSKALSLFTSSAVDWETLKCVSYTHSALYESSSRTVQMLGGASFSSTPKRHLGFLSLSHCFEFCVTFWYITTSLEYLTPILTVIH